jgi:hypothetical protein
VGSNLQPHMHELLSVWRWMAARLAAEVAGLRGVSEFGMRALRGCGEVSGLGYWLRGDRFDGSRSHSDPGRMLLVATQYARILQN